jgi:hypothetical protein
VSLADEDAVRAMLTDTPFGLWATVNSLSRLRPSRRDRFRVTVFGSARTEPGHSVCQEVKRMSAALRTSIPSSSRPSSTRPSSPGWTSSF